MRLHMGQIIAVRDIPRTCHSQDKLLLAGKAAHTPCPPLGTIRINIRRLQVRQLLPAVELIKDVLAMALDVLCQLLLEQGAPLSEMSAKASLSIAFCSQVRWVGWLQTPKY